MGQNLKFLQIKNAKSTSADVYIYGDIVDDTFKLPSWLDLGGADVFPSDIKEILDELEGKDINVYINSAGGHIFAGMAIANMLKRQKGHTKAFVEGVAASIATQIMFACDEVIIPSNAYIMIHKPSASFEGNADDFRKMADDLDKIQEGIEVTYRENALEGVSAEIITNLVNQETWLTGKDAAKFFNITVAPAVEAVAYAGDMLNKWKNAPKDIVKNEFFENKLENDAKNKVALALALATEV